MNRTRPWPNADYPAAGYVTRDDVSPTDRGASRQIIVRHAPFFAADRGEGCDTWRRHSRWQPHPRRRGVQGVPGVARPSVRRVVREPPAVAPVRGAPSTRYRGVVGLGQHPNTTRGTCLGRAAASACSSSGMPTTPSRPASRGSASVHKKGWRTGKLGPRTKAGAPRPSRAVWLLVARSLTRSGRATKRSSADARPPCLPRRRAETSACPSWTAGEPSRGEAVLMGSASGGEYSLGGPVWRHTPSWASGRPHGQREPCSRHPGASGLSKPGHTVFFLRFTHAVFY